MPSTPEARGRAREERRTPYAAIAFAVLLLMAAEGVVLYVLLRKPAPIAMAKPTATGGQAVEHSAAELEVPTVELREVIVSVLDRPGGTELHTAVLSVTIIIGRIEGRDDEALDVSYLEKVYVPKVKALLPWVRDHLISKASAKTLQELMDQATQDKMLRDLKNKLNDRLESYGVERRVREVFRESFHFD